MCALERKIHLAELLQKVKFMRQEQKVKFKAQQITIQETLAETEARTKGFAVKKGDPERILKEKGIINYSGDKSTFEKYENESLVPTFANKMYTSKPEENLRATMHEKASNCNKNR